MAKENHDQLGMLRGSVGGEHLTRIALPSGKEWQDSAREAQPVRAGLVVLRCASCGYVALRISELAEHGEEAGHSIHYGPASGNYGETRSSRSADPMNPGGRPHVRRALAGKPAKGRSK